MLSSPRLSVIVVTFNSAVTLEGTLSALDRELLEGDQVVIVDNASSDASVEISRKVLAKALIIANEHNIGFPAGCNLGAENSSGDILVFLNPDAVPQQGWGEAIRRPAQDGRNWEGWQALITSNDATKINSAGNVVHFTGVSWAGQAGVRLSAGDTRRREVAYLSGACLAVRSSAFQRVGGFAEAFFLYHEDLDLSLRLRLAGGILGIEPDARVEHAYEFHKGGLKWRLLERNRWAVIVRCWPAGLLALTLLPLTLTEIAIFITALRGGWATDKTRAVFEGVQRLPACLRERRCIQRERTISSAQFAAWLTADLDSQFLSKTVQTPIVSSCLRLYWQLVRTILQLISGMGLSKGTNRSTRSTSVRNFAPRTQADNIRTTAND